ncbi:hypothetical protein BGZ70_007979 [Mortierella alpina]|uniref:Uncharacterized protein n=1 Tax=Mortierella alpina TaxID=64518 RepID=A0A9P6JDC9_MORAP|nr:hypothetical protein BGZ70_007979 [Mortierella alpina]
MLFGEYSVGSRDCPLILVSMLSDLEDLSWKGQDALYYGVYSEVCVEDIVHNLKSCTKLRSFRLANVLNMKAALTELKPGLSNEEGWQCRSLRILECDNVQLDLDPLWIQRLFQHAPAVRTFKLTGMSYLYPVEWVSAFEKTVDLEHVELWSSKGSANSANGRLSNTAGAIAALAASCSNLRTLNAQYAYPTTDQLFEPIMRANCHLQSVCVQGTEFGCHQATSAGVLPILECCKSLKNLNLAGTSAGTLDLFKGHNPWACVESLETLQIDIQPIGFQPLSSYSARRFEETMPTPSAVLYSSQEQMIIRKRLCSLISLTVLELRGGAMDFAIVDEAPFAPRLRMLGASSHGGGGGHGNRYCGRQGRVDGLCYVGCGADGNLDNLAEEPVRTTSRAPCLMNLRLQIFTVAPYATRLLKLQSPFYTMSSASSEKLPFYASCDVADALLALKVPSAGYIPDIHLWSPQFKAGNTRVFGPAYTVQMVPVSDTEAPKPDQHFVDAIPEGTVVCISQPRNMVNAVWGGLMTARAQIKGALGVIVDGRIRDLNEQREAGFPVFAKATSIMGAGPFTRASALNVPITMQPNPDHPAVTIHPGDYIVADADGIVVIPKDLLAQVEEKCRKSVAVDDQCMEALKAGESIVATFKKYRG